MLRSLTMSFTATPMPTHRKYSRRCQNLFRFNSYIKLTHCGPVIGIKTSDYTPAIPPLVTEGCLISVSRRGAGSGGRGMTLRRRCDGAARAVQAASSRRASRAPRCYLPEQRWIGGPTIRKERWVAWKVTSTGGETEQTSKDRARDAIETADLRLFGLRQASMSRGVARGSDGPLASRAPSVLSRWR